MVSLKARDWPHLWTARLWRLGHNIYRCAVRESASILCTIGQHPEIQVLLTDDLRGVVMALRARARIIADDATAPGQVLLEIALDPA